MLLTPDQHNPAQPSITAVVQLTSTSGCSHGPQDAVQTSGCWNQAQDTCTHCTRPSTLPPWPGPSLALTLPSSAFLFSSCFLLVFQSLNEVVIWWAGHSPTFPQESATRLVLNEPLLFRVGLRFFVPGHPAPQSPQSSKEPRKQWTVRTCGTRGQTSN